MAQLQAKDRFMDTGLKINLGPSNQFPPQEFKYKEQDYTVLGASNKEHLIPANIDNTEMQRIATYGGLSQYICTDNSGNIFDACFYKDEGINYLYAISTRELPAKKAEPKKKKEEVTT